MGKVKDSELHSESSPAVVNHFSHPHPLKLFKFQPQQLLSLPSCSACKLQPSESVYACHICNYYLHQTCSQMPENITHLSHPHRLKLILSPPYHNKGFSCDICKTTGFNHWLYRCNSCEFDAHLNCAVTNLGYSPRVNVGKQNSATSSSAELLMNSISEISTIGKQATNDVSSIYNMMFPGFTSSGGVGLNTLPPNGGGEAGTRLQGLIGGGGINLEELMGGTRERLQSFSILGDSSPVNVGTQSSVASSVSAEELFKNTRNDVNQMFKQATNDISSIYDIMLPGFSSGAAASDGVGRGSWLHPMVSDVGLIPSNDFSSQGINSSDANQALTGGASVNAPPSAAGGGGGEAGPRLQGLTGGRGINLEELMGGTRERSRGTLNSAASSVSASNLYMNSHNDMNQLFKEATNNTSSLYDMMLPGFSSGGATGGVDSGSSLHAMMGGVGLSPSNDISGDANQFQALTGGGASNELPLNDNGGGQVRTRLQGLAGGGSSSVNLQELMAGTRELRQSLTDTAALTSADLFQEFLEASS